MNHPTQPSKGFRFDMSMNLGHVLTVIAFLLTAMASWNVMDKRVLVLEEYRAAQKEREATQRERDSTQDTANKDKFQEVRDALTDLRRSVEKVADKVGATK